MTIHACQSATGATPCLPTQQSKHQKHSSRECRHIGKVTVHCTQAARGWCVYWSSETEEPDSASTQPQGLTVIGVVMHPLSPSQTSSHMMIPKMLVGHQPWWTAPRLCSSWETHSAPRNWCCLMSVCFEQKPLETNFPCSSNNQNGIIILSSKFQ